MFAKLLGGLKQFILVLALTMPSLAMSSTIEEPPSGLAMTGDALLVRPVMFATTILGAVVFAVSSPFSYLGGNADEAWETLVVGPYETTFERCLGCTANGKKVAATVEQEQK